MYICMYINIYIYIDISRRATPQTQTGTEHLDFYKYIFFLIFVFSMECQIVSEIVFFGLKFAE